MQDVQSTGTRWQGKETECPSYVIGTNLPSVSSETLSTYNQYDSDLPMKKGGDELEKDSEFTKQVENGIYETPRWSGNLETVARLAAPLGELILRDIFVVMKMDLERVYHVFLFEKTMLFFKDVRKADGDTIEKSSNVTSFFGKLAKHLPSWMDPSRKNDIPVLLKGRVHLHDISYVCHSITASSSSLSDPHYSLQVWWKGGDEHFALKCRSQDQLIVWENALKRLIETQACKDSKSERPNP